MASDFVPALIVVDMQEDFCLPTGSLSVPSALDLIPTINTLLSMPFALKVLTQDWHPKNHISFASNHPGLLAPFTSHTTITNPYNPSETYNTRLWPVHCVQDTPGAAFVQGLDVRKADRIVKKGQDARVEMYSAFYDPCKSPRVSDSGLAGVLKEKGVSHVYVVGVAADYCVRFTAEDSAAERFETVIVGEGTKAVDDEEWKGMWGKLKEKGVKVVGVDGKELRRVRALRGPEEDGQKREE